MASVLLYDLKRIPVLHMHDNHTPQQSSVEPSQTPINKSPYLLRLLRKILPHLSSSMYEIKELLYGGAGSLQQYPHKHIQIFGTRSQSMFVSTPIGVPAKFRTHLCAVLLGGVEFEFPEIIS